MKPAAYLLTLALGAGALAVAAQAQQQRLPRECRQKIMRLCGTDRGVLRGCLVEKREQLSERCRTNLAERVQARTGGMPARTEADGNSLPAPTQTLSYGADPLQSMDLWAAPGPGAKPLIIFVHGGGWQKGDKLAAAGDYKPQHLTRRGYHFASINYRLVPQATVEQQAADVVAALAHLRRNAGALGIDASRVVLSGHSAGAHLVALVGTDPKYLRQAGLPLDAIRGIMPVDGAGFDVAAQIGSGERAMVSTYTAAFGSDAARHKALSPLTHAAAPNAPAFLILHSERASIIAQANAFAAALRAAGTPATQAQSPGDGLRGHMLANKRLGDPAFATTAAMDTWLEQRFR